MLILTRKEGESLRLGDDITVKVVSVKGGSVRIGVTAPRELAVHREEIYEKASAKTGEAAEGADNSAASQNTRSVEGDDD